MTLARIGLSLLRPALGARFQLRQISAGIVRDHRDAHRVRKFRECVSPLRESLGVVVADDVQRRDRVGFLAEAMPGAGRRRHHFPFDATIDCLVSSWNRGAALISAG